MHVCFNDTSIDSQIPLLAANWELHLAHHIIDDAKEKRSCLVQLPYKTRRRPFQNLTARIK